MKRITLGFLSSFGKHQLLQGCSLQHISQAYIISRSFTQWDLVGGICLERKPVITQELTPLEKRYLEFLRQLETEKSYLSDHELRHKKDLINAEKLKSGEEVDMDAMSKTAQDFEDACMEQFNKFKPAPRITEADLNNDQKSLERKLDQTLLLVVKQKLGNDHRWILPQGVHAEGETLRQTAERVLKETCGNRLKVQFMGNAPVGFYKYKYPKVARGNGICGAKVFFFKAQIQKGDICRETVLQNQDIDDYLWLTRSELNGMLQPVYLKALNSFLMSDEIPESFEEATPELRDQQTAVH